jgi:chromosome partitioning protein
VRKGKAEVRLLINRARRGRALEGLEAWTAELGLSPEARISDRAAYVELAAQGLTVFDRRLKALEPLRAEWRPLLDTLGG